MKSRGGFRSACEGKGVVIGEPEGALVYEYRYRELRVVGNPFTVY